VTRTLALGGLVLLVALAFAAPTPTAGTGERVSRVIDGDTIDLASGARVRLLQIDTPEPGTGECYSRAAGRELRALLPVGTNVVLEADPRLDRVDAYGRLLRYVRRSGVNVNLELVRRGAATVWFYRGERGRHAERLLRAGQAARTARRGIWGACPGAVWNPLGPATTGPGSGTPTTPGRGIVGGSCDASYPTVCIPPPPPDLDCGDIPHRSFKVRPPDPHRFDGEGDGLGCER
jgi:micrococcal nuclease